MAESDVQDDLRPEYDLSQLRVRKMGAGRGAFGDTARLDPDVAAAFPDADAVNAALRLLMRIAQDSEEAIHRT